jgi:hypothetical protein
MHVGAACRTGGAIPGPAPRRRRRAGGPWAFAALARRAAARSRHPLVQVRYLRAEAALVPRPRLHRMRLHGALASNARLRALVVPPGPAQQERTTDAATGTACEAGTAEAGTAEAGTAEAGTAQGRPHRISWARLKRVFDIDMQHCPNCGAGEIESIAAILGRPVIEKILTHPGLQARARPRAAARVHMRGLRLARAALSGCKPIARIDLPPKLLAAVRGGEPAAAQLAAGDRKAPRRAGLRHSSGRIRAGPAPPSDRRGRLKLPFAEKWPYTNMARLPYSWWAAPMAKPSFEWDGRKDAESRAKHGVPFALAQCAFADSKRVIAEDTAH